MNNERIDDLIETAHFLSNELRALQLETENQERSDTRRFAEMLNEYYTVQPGVEIEVNDVLRDCNGRGEWISVSLADFTGRQDVWVAKSGQLVLRLR